MTWAEDFERMHKDIGSVKKSTKDVIQQGKCLALEKYHDAKSLEKLKEEIRSCK